MVDAAGITERTAVGVRWNSGTQPLDSLLRPRLGLRAPPKTTYWDIVGARRSFYPPGEVATEDAVALGSWFTGTDLVDEKTPSACPAH
jgi:hypothetical protein